MEFYCCKILPPPLPIHQTLFNFQSGPFPQDSFTQNPTWVAYTAKKKSLDPYISKFRKHRKLSHRTGRFNLDVMATLEEVDTEPVEDIDANMEAIAVNESEPIPVREPGGPRSCVDSTNETGGDNADRARSLFYFHSE